MGLSGGATRAVARPLLRDSGIDAKELSHPLDEIVKTLYSRCPAHRRHRAVFFESGDREPAACRTASSFIEFPDNTFTAHRPDRIVIRRPLLIDRKHPASGWQAAAYAIAHAIGAGEVRSTSLSTPYGAGSTSFSRTTRPMNGGIPGEGRV